MSYTLDMDLSRRGFAPGTLAVTLCLALTASLAAAESLDAAETLDAAESVGAAETLGAAETGTTVPEPDAEVAAAQAVAPNILLLVANDLGWTDLSTGRTNRDNGSKYHQTPQIDRLAEEGMSFTAAYAQQEDTPSRATLHTGQFPIRHWVYSVGNFENVPPERRATLRLAPPSGRRQVLSPTTTTIAEVLRDAGYRTAVLGNIQGLGAAARIDEHHGFGAEYALQNRQRVPGTKTHRYYKAVQGPRGAWRFDSAKYTPFAKPYTPAYIEKHLAAFANGNDPTSLAGKPKHITDAIADVTVELIRREARRAEPFFIETAFHAAHPPVHARPDLLAKYTALEPGADRHTDPAYAALVEGLDQSVGRIVAALDDPNGDGDSGDSLRANTLVVFVSDNGGFWKSTASTPLRGSKGSFLEGGIRVPLIARMPGLTRAGAISHEAVSIADLFPTFAEVAGATLPPAGKQPLDGESLVQIFREADARLMRPALYWHFPGYTLGSLNPSTVINRRHRGRRYKLTWSYDQERYTLYDLEDDIGEQNDLLDGDTSPAHREAAARLSGDLSNWVRALRAPRGWIRRTNTRVKPPPEIESPASPR